MSGQRNIKLWIIGIVVVVVLIGVGVGAYLGKTKVGAPSDTAASAQAGAGGTDDKDLIPIKTYTRKNCTSTPILVADQKGFFKEEGLKLVFTGELKPTEILPSVLNGNNDFAEQHPNAIATFVAGGAKIKGVGRSIVEPGPEVDPKYRHMRWFVKADTGIKTWKDLIDYKKGQKLSANGLIPTCTTFLLSTITDKTGIGRDRLNFVAFDTDQAALQALQQGNIDIAGVHPPFYKMAADAGLTLVGDSSDAGLGTAAGIYLYYFTDDYISKNPDTIKKFLNAMTKAQNWSNENPDEAAQITADFIGAPASGSHYYSKTTDIPEEQVQPWIDDLVNSGNLKPGEVKLSDMLTHQFEQR
ncbi:MAG TPA: ABC transporter substrate-binding protein [Desulfitobacteriaceae bacterium]|nr:ABC transporter substrate-binding protein [Desulfitobacteriaceae bacterium]